MMKGVVCDIVYIVTCVQYKDEVFDESILLQTSRDQNQARRTKGVKLKMIDFAGKRDYCGYSSS